MRSKHLSIFLKEHENAAILTQEGTMATGVVHNKKDLVAYADVIQDLMIKVMKHPPAKEGVWLWKISENWNSVSGWQVEG